MRIDVRNFYIFFLVVSFFYIFSPFISQTLFDFKPTGVLEFTSTSLFLAIFVGCYYLPFKRYLHVDIPKIREKVAFFYGLFLVVLLLVVLESIYGSFKGALLNSYTSRTGVSTTGVYRVLFNPLIVIVSAYASLIITEFLFFKRGKTFYRYANFIVSLLIILIFLGSGNRNVVLWSISLPLAFLVGTRKPMTALLIVLGMVFVSVLVASLRNQGIGNIMQFSFPEYAYWNPIIHEYGTTYRMYDFLINKNHTVPGDSFYGQSYLDSFVNLLPSGLKPNGYLSFSDAISREYGRNGEGLGNSPVAEVILNGIFPAVLFQCLPFLILFFFMFLKKGKRRFSFLEILKFPAMGCFFIASFNFWRIGNSELDKIILSVFVGFIISFVICFNTSKTNVGN